MQEFEKRMRCSPHFNSPSHPSSTGLAQRAVGNVRIIVSKLATDHPSCGTLSYLWWCGVHVKSKWDHTSGSVHSTHGPIIQRSIGYGTFQKSGCDDNHLPVSAAAGLQSASRQILCFWLHKCCKIPPRMQQRTPPQLICFWRQTAPHHTPRKVEKHLPTPHSFMRLPSPTSEPSCMSLLRNDCPVVWEMTVKPKVPAGWQRN